MILADLLAGVRLDVRILTNQLLSDFPELAQMCIFIDPFDRPESRISNGRALRQAIRHLHSGGMMLVFPAGEVSHFDRTAARLIRITRAKSVPTLIRGANGIPFQMLAMVHSRLRTAASRIEATTDDVEATRYLRLRTELLLLRSCGAGTLPAGSRLISTHVGNPNTSVGMSADAAGESARATIWNAVCNTVVLMAGQAAHGKSL
jgi:hypothetical protein